MATPFHLDSFFRDVNVYTNPCNYTVNSSQISTWFEADRTTKAIPGNTNTRPLSLTKSMCVSVVSLPYPRPSLYSDSTLQVETISGSVITVTGPAPPNGTIIMTGTTRFGITMNMIYYVVNSAGSNFQLALAPAGVPVTLTDATPLGYELYVMSTDGLQSLNDAKAITNYPVIYLRLQSKDFPDVNLLRTINGNLKQYQFPLVLERYQFSDSGEPIWMQYKSAVPEQVYRFKNKDELQVSIVSRSENVIMFYDDPKTAQGFQANPYKQTLITFNIMPYAKDGHFTNQEVDLVGN